jgi:hypothetical protein
MNPQDIEAWARVATEHMPPRVIQPDHKHKVIMPVDFGQDARRQTLIDIVNMLGGKGCTWYQLTESDDHRVMVLFGWKVRPRLPDVEAHPDSSELSASAIIEGKGSTMDGT